MLLITAEIAKRTPELYATEEVSTEDKVCTAKFFHPSGRATFFMTEYNPDERLAFGFVVSPLGEDCDEWGYFSITELEELSVGGLGIERDTSFRPTKFKDVLR
jgi:hypothetical protein